jgi:hypothetical protein
LKCPEYEVDIMRAYVDWFIDKLERLFRRNKSNQFAGWQDNTVGVTEWMDSLSPADREKVIATMALHRYFTWADQMRAQLTKLGKEFLVGKLGSSLKHKATGAVLVGSFQLRTSRT